MPEIVGPPPFALGGPCPATISELGGAAGGANIPIAALRLGAPVSRATTSFTTGGGGTSNLAEMMRRKQAGLPFEPAMFDNSLPKLPIVYAASPAETARWYLYQRLPLKTVSGAYDANALIFAQPTSNARGRIASLALVMKETPSAAPRLRAVGGVLVFGACRRQTLDVYAPSMTAGQVHRLFTAGDCNWARLSACQRSQWPRGRVLFVLRNEKGTRATYRWVDYDLLAKARFAGTSS
jgi:hypothetical protein